jgi:nucleoside-diphosphate-sugar epimerase
MKIALTGADGFIGSNLQYFLKPYYNVIPVTRKICNLLDAAQVHEFLKLHKFDVVINLAASYSVDQNSLLDTRNNLGIFMNFYNNSNLFGKFINTGSGAEFDRTQQIHLASESSIFKSLPQDSYGFGHNIRSRLCNQKPGFYTLRIFGCFGPHELPRRLLPRFLSSQDEFQLEQDRYFDYFSIWDLCTVIKHLIDNDNVAKDMNCVYQHKIKLSTFLEKFKNIHSIDTKIQIVSTSDNSYTGDSSNLYASGIKLDGLDTGIKSYFKDLNVSN